MSNEIDHPESCSDCDYAFIVRPGEKIPALWLSIAHRIPGLLNPDASATSVYTLRSCDRFVESAVPGEAAKCDEDPVGVSNCLDK